MMEVLMMTLIVWYLNNNKHLNSIFESTWQPTNVSKCPQYEIMNGLPWYKTHKNDFSCDYITSDYVTCPYDFPFYDACSLINMPTSMDVRRKGLTSFDPCLTCW